MEEIANFLRKIQSVIEAHSKYKLEAYSFVLGALNYTVSRLAKPRHVTGQELLQGIREYALEQYGPMARLVLDYWGIKKTEDFGEIVFTLVDAGLMSKTEEDSIKDFENVYDLHEAFDQATHFDFEDSPGAEMKHEQGEPSQESQ